MSGINIIRNLQVLYFKNKKIKNLKNDEKICGPISAVIHTTYNVWTN